MAKLKKYTQEDLAHSYAPLSSTGIGEKGSPGNPYTEKEMDDMITTAPGQVAMLWV